MSNEGRPVPRRQVRWGLGCVMVCAGVLGMAVPAQAGFPGRPGMLVFSSTLTGDHEIFAAAADGSGRVDLTRDPHADVTPSWSADGRQITFASDRSSAMEIYLMNADGSGVVQLTHDVAFSDAPRFTADGRYVVYESKKGDNWEIRRIGTDGRGGVDLTRSRANDRYPATSPNGRLIAFSSDRATTGRRNTTEAHVWVMNIMGHALKPVTLRKGNQFQPAWAPTGGRLAYVSGMLKAGTNLWTVLANGKRDRRLTALGGNDQVDPSWSPDGHSLAFQECPLGGSACTLSVKPITGTPVNISPLRAPLSDTFDGTDGKLWQAFQDGGTGASNTEADGKLITTLLADSNPGGATDMIGTHWGSYCRVGGDFDVQADYQLLEWPGANGVQAIFASFDTANLGFSRSARVRPGASSTARGFLRPSSRRRRVTRLERCACSAREVPRLSPTSAARGGFRSPPAQLRHRRSRSRSVRAAAWAASVTRRSRSRGTTTSSTRARSPARRSRGKTTHQTGKLPRTDDGHRSDGLASRATSTVAFDGQRDSHASRARPPGGARAPLRAHRCPGRVSRCGLLLTAPTRAFARQINRAAPSDESSALLFSAGWSRSQQSGIWMINADGSGLGRIAAVGRDASWSPDGRLIAYVSADHWMIERTDGSGRYRVPLPVAQHASWGDRHELLAYRAAAGTGGDQSVIYSIDAGARHATRRVLERTIDSVTASVVESPTGSGYAYGTEVGDVWFTPASGKPVLLSEQPEGTTVLAFSPDGASIAIARPTSNQTERIMIVPVDGGHTRTVDTIDFVSAASWSPDGQTLALAGFEKIMLVPTTGRTSFSIRADGSASPQWSPDGHQLAYVQHGGLWLLDARTHARHRLTAANSDSSIAWQPPGASTGALEPVTVGAIPPADSSTGQTLETSGIVQNISLYDSTVVVDVAASRLHCERLLRWRPKGTLAELKFGPSWRGAGCTDRVWTAGNRSVASGCAVCNFLGRTRDQRRSRNRGITCSYPHRRGVRLHDRRLRHVRKRGASHRWRAGVRHDLRMRGPRDHQRRALPLSARSA